MNVIGNNIKRLRKERKMTQQDLANRLGVKPTAVSAWEVGRSNPLMDNVEKMAEIFCVSKMEIISEAHQKESDIPLSNSQVDSIVKQAEALYGVSLSDDPDVLEAMKQLIYGLAKIKSGRK